MSLGSAPPGWAAVYAVRGEIVRHPIVAWALVESATPTASRREVVGVVLSRRRPVLADQVEGGGVFRGYSSPDDDLESLRARRPDPSVWLS